jgi:hypothetical protein
MDLMASRRLITVMLASIYRSTQFFMHGSSLRSSWPEEMLEVMHLRKHLRFVPSAYIHGV